MDYINAPVGKAAAPVAAAAAAGRDARPPPAPAARAPRSACSTCCRCKVKTGISHPTLRPTLAVVDPTLTVTQPAMVTAASGMDILCHALESYTARWYADFDAKQPEQRVPYCGANPIADMWSEKALSLLAGAFRTAVRDGGDTRGARADGDGRDLRRARASATPACTSRTPTPTRSPAGSATTARRATPRTSRSCRTGWRSR